MAATIRTTGPVGRSGVVRARASSGAGASSPTRPARRADAERNRAAILAAADRLFDDAATWDSVTTSDIAEAAGVGKGSVFRAFGDRAGLLRALMSQRTEQVMTAVGEREPPSATAPSPREQVTSLLDALLQFKLANRQLSLALESVRGASPYDGEHYAWWHDVLAAALRGSDRVTDPGFIAHMLLAAVRSDLIEYLVTAEGRTPAQLRATLRAYVQQAVG